MQTLPQMQTPWQIPLESDPLDADPPPGRRPPWMQTPLPPPVNRMDDRQVRCENIIFPRTSFAGGYYDLIDLCHQMCKSTERGLVL